MMITTGETKCWLELWVPLIQALEDGQLQVFCGDGWVDETVIDFRNPPSRYRRKPKAMEIWINVYRNKSGKEYCGQSCSTREHADLLAKTCDGEFVRCVHLVEDLK